MTVKKPTGSEQSESPEKSGGMSDTEKQEAKNSIDLLLVQRELDTLHEVLEQEKAFNAELRLRLESVNSMAFVYQHAVPLGENGELVGNSIVDAARVIERYLSGNSD
jgi:hypothetical protein